MYTSGRTVKSSKRRQPTTVASATREARKLVNRYLPIGGVMIDSTMTAHTETLEPLVRTTISYPGTSREMTCALADAVTQLPGYHSMAWSVYHLSFVRTV